jgi:hypothetical protein
MKEGRTVFRPSPLSCLRCWLEVHAQAKLNPARAGIAVRGDELGVDHAEVRQVGGIQSWIEESRVVERVEEVERILELQSFPKFCNFSNAQIEILEPEAAQRPVTSRPSIGG